MKRKYKLKAKKQKTHLSKKFIILLLSIFIFLFLIIVKSNIFFAAKSAAQEFISSKKDSTYFQSLVLITPTTSPTPIKQDPTPLPGFCLNVPILMYHHIQPLSEAQKLGHAQLTVDNSVFDQQMQYLVANGYTTISSEQVVNALLSHQQLPAKSIVITLDDGYDDAYNYAYPIAKKYNINLDLMIPSGLLNNFGYLSWDQLKEMSGNSLIHIYNHSWSHKALGAVDRSEIEREVMTANNDLESRLGRKINILAYPYGSYSYEAMQVLREKGFVAALSTDPGMVQCDSFIMALRRTRIGGVSLGWYGF